MLHKMGFLSLQDNVFISFNFLFSGIYDLNFLILYFSFKILLAYTFSQYLLRAIQLG